MSRVLIVDDHRSVGEGMAAILRRPCDLCRCLDDVRAAGDPSRWSTAFVDFDLGSTTETGLSVLEYLYDTSPATRRVVHTSLSESGRILFTLAARWWFDVKVVVDKEAPADTLRRALDPQQDPTPPGWQAKFEMAKQDGLIDNLLQDGWLTLWRLWPTAMTAAVASKRLPGHRPEPRAFASKAIKYITKYREIFELATVMPRPLNWDP